MSSDTVSTLSLRLESDRFDTGLRYSQTLMRGLGQEGIALTSVLRQTGAAMAGLVLGSGAVKGLLATIHAASRYREDLAQFNHVMRNVSKTADEMVRSLTSDAYGRTGAQARQMLMTMTSLAKGMGMTDKAAVELSGQFSKMAVDIGSFLMVQPESVMNAFQSAMMGNTIALRTYGVHLNEATLKETIAANAKKGMVFASERQARATAILTETQRQQADAIGDYAVESQQFGNQLKKFYGGLGEIPAKFGAGLLAPANEFLKVANGVIDTMCRWDESTWKTIAGVTALGTGATLLGAGYRIIREGALFYRAAQIAALRTTTENTAAITAETAALHANTAARSANASAAVRRLPPAVSPRRTPLPYQYRRNVWDEQAATLRTAHSRVNNEIAVATAARDAASRRYTQTGDIRYLDLASRSTVRLRAGERRQNNLERNMQSLNDARRRNPLHLTDRQRAERRAVMRDNVSRGRYARAQRTFSRRTRGIRRSPLGLVGRGVGGVARAVGQATGLTFIVRSFGSMVMRWIPTAARTWGGVALRAIGTALLPIGGTVLAALNPVGWAATILTGIAAVGNYLPTLMYKAYDGFVSLFTAENMSRIWDFFKSSALSVYDWLGKGLYGIGLVAESIFYTAINALGNGLRAIIKTVTLGAFEYKSSGYAAYEQQKHVNELQSQLDDQRAEQAKCEKQIAEFRSKVSEQERKWLEQEEETLKKRSDLASGRFDSFAKADSLGGKLHFAESLTSGLDFAIQSVQRQMKEAGDEWERIVQSGGSEETLAAAREKYHAAEARMDELQKQKSAHSTGIAEMRYSLFDAQFENAGKQKGSQSQMGAYTALMSSPQIRLNLARQQQVESEHDAAQQQLTVLLQEHMQARADADEKRSGLLLEEIENAKRRVAESETAYNELQAALSDQQKLQDRMDELNKEQEKRHKDAQNNLWNFNFDHAPKSVQQQMARSAFFKAQNQFEGAESDDEREEAFQHMQSMYGKVDKNALEMPVWNGFLNTTAGAIESDSVAAQELQERIMNDFNKVMIDETKKQSVMQAAMRAAFEQIVKNTDPNQQQRVGGSA